jgi:O-acetylhomoserine/O-acetylserine sulfhydrylase
VAVHKLTPIFFLQDLIRISVGTEHIDDIIHDFEQSFAASSALKTGAEGHSENAEKSGKAVHAASGAV